MTELKMPELPEPEDVDNVRFAYTADQMREFARAAIEANKRAESEPSNVGPVELDDDKISDFIDTLRGFTKAYPEDIFTPLTEAERKQMGSLLDRASAGMGRHMAKFMAQAADMIERLAAPPSAQTVAQERERIVVDLVKLYDSRRPAGGVHGQIVGLEPYVIRANGNALSVLLDAAELISAALAAPAQLSDEQILQKADDFGIDYDGSFYRNPDEDKANLLEFARALLSAAQGKESGNG